MAIGRYYCEHTFFVMHSKPIEKHCAKIFVCSKQLFRVYKESVFAPARLLNWLALIY